MIRWLVAALVVVALPLPARAQSDDEKPQPQHVRFVERGEDLTATTKFGQLFDEPAFRALRSGFPSTIVIRLWVFPRDSNAIVQFTPMIRSVVYDIWDEIYTVQLETGSKVKVKSPAEALKLLTTLEDIPVAKLADLPYEDVFVLAMRIDLNPVSKETLAEVRRWLSQGTGGGLDRGGAFFGSFVSVFVNPKIAEADRVLRLRSQPFYRPKP